ncbi:TonB-dependent receptor [Sphingomonas solaris]|uniref:TonB-dependent receptor n=1 Tax=Alterirhizorhabdus solaris TaxID=2529389 RepID=A0A558R520_9SPHN|nr:TonB-dependent receptor [Sphingomonas solaris]TVV74473.1 TonB-dependent receptor [Sphingomonas solaris]
MRAYRKLHSSGYVALATGIALGLSTTSTQASAQTADGGGLNDIVVTAQRRAERLEDVPASITAATQETLTAAGVTDIHDLDQIAPGVQISFTGAYTQPSIRGVTTLTAGPGWENNVAVYIDGFYSPAPVGVNVALSNLQDIQIFKGPQGTLYGRNATGGAILINTRAPTAEFTLNAEASYARFDDVSLNGFVSGPITDTLRVGVAGTFRRSDGYYRSVDPAGSGGTVGNAANIRQQSIRAKAEWDATPDLKATIGYNYVLIDDPTTLLFPNQGYAPSFLPAEPLAGRAPYRASSNVNTSNEARVHEGTLKLVYKTGFGNIASYTGYQKLAARTVYDFDGTYLPILDIDGPNNKYTFQHTTDVTIDSIDRLNLVVGGSYYNDVDRNDGSKVFLNSALASFTYARLTAKAWAAYFDATYDLTDRLILTVGGRYTRERKGIRYRQLDASQTINLVPAGASSATFSDFTPRATLRYELSPRTNVYASFSQGFRTGGFQPTPAADPSQLRPFRPEKITAYEIGFKTAQSIVRFDASAFYYDYTDLQVGVTRANPVTNSLISFVSNAPSAEIYGLDLQGSVEPVRGLSLMAGASLLHARYKRFPGITGVGLDPATNLNFEDVQDWSGLQMTRAPDFSGNAGASYETALANGTLRLSGNVSYSGSSPQSNPSVFGSRAGALARVQRYRNSAYTLVNAQVGWAAPGDHVTLTLFATNLTKERYYINYGGTTIFGDVGVFNQPRTVGIRLRYQN